jgi:hypothetical protein
MGFKVACCKVASCQVVMVASCQSDGASCNVAKCKGGELSEWRVVRVASCQGGELKCDDL